jgi:hypothetical protein
LTERVLFAGVMVGVMGPAFPAYVHQTKWANRIGRYPAWTDRVAIVFYFVFAATVAALMVFAAFWARDDITSAEGCILGLVGVVLVAAALLARRIALKQGGRGGEAMPLVRGAVAVTIIAGSGWFLAGCVGLM